MDSVDPFARIESLIKQLVEIGVERPVAEHALQQTGYRSLDEAMNWVLDKNSTPVPPLPTPTPTSSLSGVAEEEQECKLVLLVRADLEMGVGKIAAQCSHATLGLYETMKEAKNNKKNTLNSRKVLLRNWKRAGEPTIVLKIHSEKELEELKTKAEALGLATHIVEDAGRTQVESGSRTVLAIFGPNNTVDSVSGNLKLL